MRRSALTVFTVLVATLLSSPPGSAATPVTGKPCNILGQETDLSR
jgi:hypothetical protein